jgi:hypothetical protein
VAEAEKQEFESFNEKKLNLIENNNKSRHDNTATTVKEDPWEFTKS